MVNLGFEADLTFILDKLPSEAMEGEDQGEQMDVDGETMVKKGRNRVTTLFSATMPPPVERLAKKYLKKPAIITIGEAGRAVDTVEQNVEFVQGDEKRKWEAFLDSRVSPNLPRPFLGNGCWRSSTAAIMLHLSSSSSTRRRRRTWWPKTFPVQGQVGYLCVFASHFSFGCFTVERVHPALWQEPRTARGRFTSSPLRRRGRPCGYRSRWSWYRRDGCQFGCQLPDVEHD